MGERFETWARTEIERLRAEARQREVDAVQLEAVLARFVKANSSSTKRQERDQAEMGLDRPSDQSASGSSRRRASKNEALYDAFAAAGSDGLGMDELEEAAKRLGINSNRNNLRAFCWTAKNAGRLISLAPGRYAIAPKNEAAAPTPVDSAAASETHAQAREAGAGGGT